MTAVSLATCAALPDGDEDAGLLTAALARHGVHAEWTVWTDPHARWDESLVVLRSTWDYTSDLPAFLRWTRQVERLENPADVVAWNTDKTYLRDLVRAGVPCVPTAFAAPGDAVDLPAHPPTGEYVVKPSVGAGSRGAGRFTVDRAAEARRHAAVLHDAGRVVLVQPYLASVDAEGETALLYFDGRFSHAVRKGPMLGPDTAHAIGETRGLYIEENITARGAAPAELAVGERVLGYLADRFGTLLYTRIDLLPTPDGPVVVEVELSEPSLFFEYAPDPTAAADAFAAAIAARA